MPLCVRCGHHFDQDDYFDEDLYDDMSVCPDCYFLGGGLPNQDDELDDIDDIDYEEEVYDALPDDYFDDGDLDCDIDDDDF